MKRIISLVMALALVLTAMVVPAVAENQDVRTVEFWHTLTGVNGAAVEAIADHFNATVGAEKGIVVKAVYQGNDNSEKLKPLAQASDFANFPDVAMIAGAGIPSAVTYDSLVPVGTLIDREGNSISRDDLEPNMLRSYTYENQLVGMPFSCSAIMLYYNCDMFREVGLDPNTPPTTIAEMADDISKLMVKDGDNVTRYGLNVAVRRYQLANWIGGQGDYNFFGDNEGGRTAPMTKVTFGEDGTLRNFLTEWQKVIATGGYKPYEDDINEEFSLELFGMAIMSTARIGKIKSLVGDKFEWNVAALPKVNADDKGGIAVGGSCVVMFDPDNDPAQVDATWEFVQFMVSAEEQFQFHQATGYIPVNKTVYDLPEADKWFEENPMYKVAIDCIHASNPNVQEPFDIINWEIDSVIKTHMLAFANGEETLDECHDRIVEECNERLDDYHLAND